MPPLSLDNTVWVAYSGGCDSHVLLHALAQLRREQTFNLKAIYVNHGLSANAARWGEHCKKVCCGLGVELSVTQVDATPARGESPEAAARRARYDAIIDMLHRGDYLCTAHHQDDQAETLILQLLRGAGPKGLAAMSADSPLGKAIQLRPLLNFSRLQLQRYAETHGLRWIEDESNSDTGYNRNYLRHEVMPLLRARWPSADTTISRSANHCAEAAHLLNVLAQQDYQTVKAQTGTEIDIARLLMLDNARLKNVLRYWIGTAGLALPSEIKLQHIITDVLHAGADKTPLVQWPGAEVRRFDGRLYLMPPLPEFDTTQIIAWDDLSQPLCLPDGSVLTCEESEQRPALDLAVLKRGRITLRYRQGGESCQPAGSAHHKSLKQIFQERRVPPWLRTRLPLLYVDDCLAAVVGGCLADAMVTHAAGSGVMLRLSR